MPDRLKHDDCRGIFAAILTPLTAEERLDRASFERLAHALLDEGQRGLYVAGGTGEGYGLDDAVRIEAFRAAAGVAQARKRGELVIAHVGGVHTRRAIAMAAAAADAGCDAIAALPPTGARYSHAELTAFYRELAAATPLPLLVYHHPVGTGYACTREELSRWLELPNVLGIKFTSDDMFRFERLAALHPDKAVFNGADEMLVHGLTSGAVGAIGTTYNLVGPLAVALQAAFTRGDHAAARTAQGALNHFVEAFIAAGGMRGFKALVGEIHGWPNAASPAPGATPSPEAYRRMRPALEEALALARRLGGIRTGSAAR
jgi:N-acetylneuraminate lyase